MAGRMIIMERLIWGFVVVAIMVMTSGCWCGVTEEQMRNSGKMIRDICQPKFKISEDVANAVQVGKIPDDQNTKCYVNCILEMMNSMKKGKFNYESTLKQIDLLMPDHMKEAYRTGTDACKGAADGIKNNCDAAASVLNCMNRQIPGFFFP